ncbi:unnamed protein product, partial [Rotaria sp. Silwood2]
NLHTEYIQSFKTENESQSEFIVFRGQELRNLKDNVNGRIAMNSLLSTSTLSNTAFGFAGNRIRRPLIESVFFKIHCPLK